jgi:HNH endonuclease
MDIESAKERLLAKRLIDEAGCWIWTGYRNLLGYGEITIRGKGWRTHRLSHVLFVGPIAPKLQVCHTCDVPSCFNPQHLWLGTAQENRLDAVKKGRDPRALKTECKRGHPYAAHGYSDDNGWRQCRECDRTRYQREKKFIGRSAHFCIHGHELTTETLRIDAKGRRRCRVCARESLRRRYPPKSLRTARDGQS